MLVLQAKTLMPLVLQPEVAEPAAKGVAAPTTWKKFEDIEDEHNKCETIEILTKLPFIYQQDSGKKQDVEHHAERVMAYLPDEDVVYQQLLGVRAIVSTKGADLADAQLETMKAFKLDPHLQLFSCSDTCASIVGQNAKSLPASKGLIERVRQQTDSILVKHTPCVSHGGDLGLRAGLLKMTGKDPVWYARPPPACFMLRLPSLSGNEKAEMTSCHLHWSIPPRLCATSAKS